MTMPFLYSDDPPGAGKSDEILGDIAAIPGLYLIAVPTTDLMGQHEARLRSKLASAGMRCPITSLSHLSGHAMTVNAAIHAHIATVMASPTHHAVVLISHQSLMTMNWARPEFQAHRWHLIVDEAPEAWSFATMFFEVSYDEALRVIAHEPLLDGQGGETQWAKLGLTPYGRKLAQSGQDYIADAIAPLLDLLADNRLALCNISFFGAGQEDKKKRVLHIGSVLQPEMLAPFGATRFLAAGFRHSLIFKLWSNLPEVEFIRQPLKSLPISPSMPVGQRVRIHWFSPRAASKNAFEGKDEPLKVVAERLNKEISRPFYFAVNNGDKRSLKKYTNLITNIFGKRISTKCQGSNEERDYTAAAWLAGLKASPHEYTLLNLVYGISRDELDRAREYEALFQFATRSNVRVSTSTAIVDIYVFDQFQAKALAGMLGAEDVRHIDLGISPKSPKEVTARDSDSKGGRPKKYATKEEAKAAKKKQNADRYQANKVGNPAKAA
ncbi:hypothetical protein [Magnetospirillum gryphiswaldense]|uniref:Uncharacterized protein n=1 Tax=Magnetospirillum gryphiswaldense TaxID=55518 RepID=A4U321_9PROT|nr:hypothetical protein [Magnetospirillum gryphiswaldense]AVM75798.1 hypothetical protein MSR1_33350 [Magnetospirillum gryphiswaldense MSR-1]AVM79701.1 hypothetical protein MSR1L_33350 [Magnetospirillum gryphiswaldense]CAM77278.1 conserved hypothetical protein [Magnetospirillum gryphiswaldense MSR-1]